ncbi:MAG TPA: hypothetical protein VHJ20_05070 [Polyangia bacterium]|nr:hypothetical protein [Polyangia bacterium]
MKLPLDMARLRMCALALALTGAACGEASPAADTGVAPSAESAEISVRFDVSAGKPATVEVLAFRATTTTATSTSQPVDPRTDVLGIVDPLAAEAPADGCVLRDIDLATKALALRGGSIDLQELTGVGVGLAAAGRAPGEPWSDALLRPFPRLYPDVATVVGGVVAEAGPQKVTALPERVTLVTAESELPVVDLAVPAAPRASAVNGAAFTPGLSVAATDGLSITVANGAGGRVELRPYGATVAAICAIPSNAGAESIVTVPRGFVETLAQRARATAGAPLAVSLEVARRAHLIAGLGGAPARVSVEVRSAATVELRP